MDSRPLPVSNRLVEWLAAHQFCWSSTLSVYIHSLMWSGQSIDVEGGNAMICSQPVILYIFFVCFVFTTRLTLQFIGVYRGHLNIKKREKRKGKKICAHQNEEARSELDCLHFSYKVQFFFSTNHRRRLFRLMKLPEPMEHAWTLPVRKEKRRKRNERKSCVIRQNKARKATLYGPSNVFTPGCRDSKKTTYLLTFIGAAIY